MKILLATDGSDYADAAAAQCGEFVSGVTDANVKILTVVDYTVDAASEPFTSSDKLVAAVEEAKQKKSQEILSKTAKIVGYGNEDVEISNEVRIGSPKKLIVEEAERWGANIIFVGSHGYGLFARAILGSVSDAVLNHSSCSVLIARKSSKGKF